MSTKIMVTLVPTANQTQQLLDTMTRYHELCNCISQVTVEHNHSQPINLNYWKVNNIYDTLYHQVVCKFPGTNNGMVMMAFRKVGQSYSKTKVITGPLQFSGDVDYNSYMVSIPYISPLPDNIGVIRISMLSGYHLMRFEFDHDQRKHLRIALSFRKYCEYKLSYDEGKFCLSRNLGDSQIKAYQRYRYKCLIPIF